MSRTSGDAVSGSLAAAVARLHGARLATATETEEGRRVLRVAGDDRGLRHRYQEIATAAEDFQPRNRLAVAKQVVAACAVQLYESTELPALSNRRASQG